LFKGLLNRYLCENHEQESLSSIKEFKLFFVYYEKFILLRVVVIFNFIAVVNIWRGLWILQTIILHSPDDSNFYKAIVCVISIVMSLIVLVLINRVSAILSRGNCKDELFFLKEKYIVIETLSTRVLSLQVCLFRIV
jgi:hypothetical protein